MSKQKNIEHGNQMLKGQIKNMCGSGYPTYPNILAPTLNFFLQILKFEENIRKIQSKRSSEKEN